MTHPGRWGDPYAGIAGRRLFVAVPLPTDVRAVITDIVEAVRSQPLPPGERDVRWVRLDGLHLTLRFLGPTPEERVAATEAAIARAAASAGAIRAELGGAGTFPPHGRPRTLWIGLTAGDAELATLARTVDAELASAGWPAETRPFRAHLTLARSDGIAVGRLVAERLVEAVGVRRVPFVVDRVGLFESITGGGPARYVPVLERDLAAP